ncbi:MAG: hypothetical protein LBN33_04600 [Desulfovibrio sp.]|jgi:hypothetical protein|nr:hypothetical protein [Desulfovibrio sp.]
MTGKMKFVLALALVAVLALPSAPSALSDDEIGKFQDSNKNFRAMYFFYDLAMMNAYNSLKDDEYAALEKENNAALSADAEKYRMEGMGKADACAFAYQERILHSYRQFEGRRVTTRPHEGYYELTSDTLSGFMTIDYSENLNKYQLFFVVWMKAQPAKFGRGGGEASEKQGKLVTSAVQLLDGGLGNDGPDDSGDPKVQIEISFGGKTATVKTPPAFKARGTAPKGIVIDGQYALTK